MRPLACLFAAVLPAVPAAAVPIHAGSGTYPLAGTTLAQDPELAGTAERDDLVPFKITEKNKVNGKTIGHGTLQVRVVRTKAGKLHFYWRIMNDAGSVPITLLVIGNFPDHAYDASWRIDGLGTAAPDGFVQSPRPAWQGGNTQQEFTFGKTPVMPGTSSRFVLIKTDATAMGKGEATPLADAGQTPTVSAFAPVF